MTEDEMMLLSKMQREEEERNRSSRKKKSGGGCCSTIFLFLIAIVVLNRLSGASDSDDSSDQTNAPTTEMVSDVLPRHVIQDEQHRLRSNEPQNVPSSADEEEATPQRVRCDKTNSIHILNLQMLNPNDEGGIDVGMVMKNTSNKTIVKFKCLFTFCDNSGGLLADEYSEKRIVSCIYTNSLAPGDMDMDKWVNVFTNESAVRVVLRQITLYYDDGSYLEINDTSGL